MKKTRHRTLPPPASGRARPFALQPLAFASLVALAGPALALPTGGTVAGGQATIQNPTPALQVVTQGTPKAVIDWTTFSIAPGETVRFDQPSASAVLLNRVTGYDPSAILGRMQSNGRIFLLNPYGVVFGAGARVDVGGLVASSLSLSSADFMAGRFALGTDGAAHAPAQRGEVRNEGTISAPGGVVVLAGPVVTNTGTIAAAGGRVGLAAAQEALVDVEGDGLVFFRTTGTEAGNRLAQLGRIQADGGSVELRAAARGAFADTVLNLGGVVQARSLGMKDGRVVIDGGNAGITRVAGTVDTGGAAAGERGGQISVRGQKVLLDHEAVLNASGDAGGGKVTVGGDWQGRATAADAGTGANAEMTHVAGGARIDVAATGRGDGGTAVVWADQSTRLYGTVDARGGPSGGNGGRVEVSGHRHLDFAGTVRSDAPLGLGGELLLDPADITIAAGNSTGGMSATSPFEAAGNGASNLDVDVLNGALGGNGVVRVSSGTGAGGSITVNANVTATGSATLQLESNGAVTLNNPVSLNGGSFVVLGVDGAGAASFTSTAGGTISTTPSAAGAAGGSISITTSGSITLGAALTTSGGPGGGSGGNVTLATDGAPITLLQANALAGTVSLTGSTVQLNNTLTTTVVLDTTGTTTLSAAGQALDVSGTTTGALRLTGASATVNHTGALNLGPGSIAGALDVTASGAVTQSGALSVGGTTSVDAGSADIALTQAGNDFVGLVTLTGGAIGAVDANDLNVLATPGLGRSLSLVAQGALTIPAGAIDTGAGDLTLSSGTALVTSGALHGANVTLVSGSGGITLNHDVGASGTLMLSTQDAAITQLAGNITVGTTTSIASGSGAITLASAGNDFQGAVALAGGAVQIRDASALALGGGSVASLALVADGAVAQTGAITVAGTTSVAAGTGDVALAHPGNDFGGPVAVSGGAISVADATDLNVVATPGANLSLALVAGGTLTIPGGNIDTGSADLTLSSGTGLGTSGALRGAHVTLGGGSGGIVLNNDVGATGALTLTTTGAAITQSAGNITVGTTTDVDAGTGNVTLLGFGNDFRGTVNLSGGITQVRDANALTLGSVAVNWLGVASSGPLDLGRGNVAGLLVALSGGGAITQSGALAVGGNATIDAGGGSVTLTQAGNDFSTLAVAGGAIALRDLDDLTLGTVTGSSLTIDTSAGHGAVTQTGALSITGSTTIDAGAGNVTLTHAGNQFTSFAATAGALAVVDAAGGIVLGPIDAASLTLDTAAGQGAVTQTGAVQVGGATSIAAGSGHVTLTHAGNDFGTFAVAGGAIAIADRNALTVTSLVSGPDQAVSLIAGDTLVLPGGGIDTGAADLTLASTTGVLDVNGPLAGRTVALTAGAGITLGANVTSSADQTYTGSLSLTADAALNAGAGRITLEGTVDGGGHHLGLTSGHAAPDAIRTGAAVANVASFAAAGHTTLGGNVASSGDQTYSATLVLATDATLDAGAGRITLQGPVEGGGHRLALASGHAAADAIRTGATVADVASFSAAGRTTLGGNVIASGGQAYSASLALAADVALDAGAGRITLQGAVDGGGHHLALTSGHAAADAIRTGAAVANVTSFSATGGTTLGGNVTTSGDQTYSATLALTADAALAAGAGRITLQGAVDGGGHHLALTSGHAAPDAIRTGAAVANVASFSATGNTTLGGSVAASGAQTYSGPVQLTVATTLTGTRLELLGTVDGAQALTLAGSGTTTLGAVIGGTTALSSITASGGGTTQLGSAVTTTGTQDWGDALVLTGATALSGSTLTFGGTIDGAHALTAAGSASTAIFHGAIGRTTALATLDVTGPTQLDGGSVTTTGRQDYAGAVTLGADTVLAANGIGIAGALDGAHALTVVNAGTTRFGGAVGSNAALSSLTTQDQGTVVLDGAGVTTTGAQGYSGSVRYADRATFSAGALSFGADVTGGQDLTLHTDTLELTGRLTGAGTLSIAPRSADRSIGVAGGAGDLQVTQALLGGAGGFAAHHIGRTDGSGPITVGTLTLASDTILRSDSGDLTVAGSIDGGFALALDTGGTTRILGPIGTNAALRSLTTDNHGAVADWDGMSGERTLIDVAAGARIVTTGAQTYHDPLVALGAVRFDASAVTATQATNRFEGRVEAAAGQLDLRSRSALVLGDVTLAAGGRIETDETLELAGALRLDAGTLSLLANGQPHGGALTDPDLEGRGLALGPEPEASATIFERQGGTGSVATAPGSLLVLRSPQGGSILLDNETDTSRNDLLGDLSAVSGTPGRDTVSDTLGFIRIASSEIHAVGMPPAEGSPVPPEAGIEADVLKLSADRITTGATGQLRARLPFDNFLQGSDASIPGLTLIMSPTALTIGGGFGLSTPDGYIQVRVGNELGGFLTVRPRPATGENAFVLLAGPDPRPFYDLNAKSDTVRVFYNGDAPRTPQETGALSALMATVEDARQTRFDEAVRTENVKSRLRSGVIAEVGAGRPATVGRESIRLPSSCDPKGTTLQCE